MAQGSKTGKAGGITLGSTAIVITDWDAKTKNDMVDTTDSSNYDASTDQLYAAQLRGKQSQEVSFSGHWDSATSPSGLFALLNASATVAATLLIDQAGTAFCDGHYDLSDAALSLKVDGAVDISGTLMSNGKINYH